MNLRFKNFLLVSLMLVPLVCGAQTSIDRLLTELKKSYEGLTDFKADFIQKESNPIFDREKISKGVIYSLKGRKIFWQTKTPKLIKVISNDKKIWLYDPESRDLLQETWDHLNSETKVALLFLAREADLRHYFTVEWLSKKNLSLKLIPKNFKTIKKIHLYLSKNPLFPQKLYFYYPLGRLTTLHLTSIKFNQHLLELHQTTPLDPNISQNFEFQSMEKIPLKSE